MAILSVRSVFATLPRLTQSSRRGGLRLGHGFSYRTAAPLVRRSGGFGWPALGSIPADFEPLGRCVQAGLASCTHLHALGVRRASGDPVSGFGSGALPCSGADVVADRDHEHVEAPVVAQHSIDKIGHGALLIRDVPLVASHDATDLVRQTGRGGFAAGRRPAGYDDNGAGVRPTRLRSLGHHHPSCSYAVSVHLEPDLAWWSKFSLCVTSPVGWGLACTVAAVSRRPWGSSSCSVSRAMVCASTMDN